MKFADYDQFFKLTNNSIYGIKIMPKGYGKVFAYCAKIFRDNDCELVNLYIDTDNMAFIFKKNGVYHSSNCGIKYYNDFLDSAEKRDFESSAGLTLKVIARIARVEEVKL